MTHHASMSGYYAEKLSGERLRACYDLASGRVRRYLEAEIAFVRGRLTPADSLLELGCGYGRVVLALLGSASRVTGIDTSRESLLLARRLAGPESACAFFRMDATALAFPDGAFDVVACVQNGISAFGADPERLVREALRVVRPGGRAMFSTYAAAFWPERLRWFEAQAAAGLLGEIDRERTGDGTIVCRDGFRTGTLTPETFRALGARVGAEPVLSTVDDSSVFCEIRKPSVARNPWLDIPLEDYEAHMALPAVGQSELLADLLERAVAAHAPGSVALLGCAGGNGLERLEGTAVRRIVAVDINPEYVERARIRFAGRLPGLELCAGDIQDEELGFRPVDLAFAGLLFEYVDIARALERIAILLRPGGVLVAVLQSPSRTAAEITPSPFTSLGALAPILRLVPPARLAELAGERGFRPGAARTVRAPGGKDFHVQEFRREAARSGRTPGA